MEQLQEVAVRDITPSPFQHRRYFDDASIEELARSIETDGLVQPIMVRSVGDAFEMIAGERRWRAAKLIGDTILARVVEIDDLQARRLCATENLQRADLTSIERVNAICELVDSELNIAFGEEYTALAKVQEPRWRVKALLSKLKSDKVNNTDYFMRKFAHKTEAVFSGLPQPVKWIAFNDHDLPLLFTSDELQAFAMRHKLNKSQAKAVAKLAEKGGDDFKEVLSDDSGKAFIDYMIDKTGKNDAADYEDVRDFSAGDIKQVSKTASRESRDALRNFTLESAEPVQKEAPIEYAPITYIGDHIIIHGDNTDPEVMAHLPDRAALAFCDPPYNSTSESWDGGHEWQQDYLADRADIVAVTPGISAIHDFMQKTAMPYKWSTACVIKNGMARGALGFGNWMYTALFSHSESLHRNAQDIEEITINSTDKFEDHLAGAKRQKPPAYLAWLFTLLTKEGDTIIDAFGGSGTTMAVAHRLGRKSITIERDRESYMAIVRRAHVTVEMREAI